MKAASESVLVILYFSPEKSLLLIFWGRLYIRNWKGYIASIHLYIVFATLMQIIKYLSAAISLSLD